MAGTATTIHPAYALLAPVWEKLNHVYHGTGGFLDGTYLVAHPREYEDHTSPTPTVPSKKLKARRKLARYENIAATILDQKRAAIFKETIVRTIGGKDRKDADHPLRDWWDNVDGAECSIDDWMSEAFTIAASIAHAIHVMDRPANLPADTAADQVAPFLRLYAPLDMPDWLTDERGKLTAVRLLEAVPRTTLKDSFSATDIRERILTETQWELVRQNARTQDKPEGGAHGFGRLPVVMHYAKRPGLAQVIGKSVLNDPNLYIDLYNLTSEIRELLRGQTFGLLNVVLGTGENATSVETALTMLGQEKGTENIVFSPGESKYLQPDAANVTVYQQERSELIRTIYRLCAVPWESDSQDAEAEGSLKLKREDMNQILAGYADECERTEYQIVELWFRSQYGESWERELERADVVIRYPDTFDVTPFADILEQAQAAITLEMGPTFMTELKRRLVPKFLPDVTDETLAKIVAELEKVTKESADMDRQQKKAELQAVANLPKKVAA